MTEVLLPSPAPQRTSAATPETSSKVRWFGRLQLIRLLGRSERTMAWSVLSPGSDQAQLLVLPRRQPPSADALDQWQAAARQAERLKHPHLAALVQSGVRDGWPFMLYDSPNHSSLAELLSDRGLPGAEAVQLVLPALQGLAYAHEAGLAHHDVQSYFLLVGEGNHVSLAGLGAALCMPLPEPPPQRSRRASTSASGMQIDWRALQRSGAERDVLAMGLVLHETLVGKPALDLPDTGEVLKRMPPEGHEIVRMPWNLTQPLSEPLRAILNRATDRQERQRYRGARTLISALEGWQVAASEGGGPLALLIDRLGVAGVIPALPGAAERAARLAQMDGKRTSELAEVVLEDLALSFELLRLVNASQARSSQGAGGAPVLTIKRAIAMLGMDGVRRAATATRRWPGPLDEAGATALAQQFSRTRRAARLAMALRPAGYDTEVVFLVTVLQDLGRLVVRYHFPDEAAQVERLMQPAVDPRVGGAEQPGMTEMGAAFAVLGSDMEAMGQAVARHWGLEETVLTMTRRLALDAPVHKPTSDEELLRTLASCAHETVDSLSLPSKLVPPALARVLQRYSPALGLSAAEVQAAMQEQGTTRIAGHTEPGGLDELPAAQAAVAPQGFGR